MPDPTTASAEAATGTIALSIPNMPNREMQVLLRDTVAMLVARFPEAAVRWTDGPTTASAEAALDNTNIVIVVGSYRARGRVHAVYHDGREYRTPCGSVGVGANGILRGGKLERRSKLACRRCLKVMGR